VVLFRFIVPEDEQASHDAKASRRAGQLHIMRLRLRVLDEPEFSYSASFIP